MALKQSRKHFEVDVRQYKTGQKDIFAYVRSKSKTTAKIGNLTSSAGKELSDMNDVVEELNNQFTSVFVAEDSGKLPSAGEPFDDTVFSKLTEST